MIANQETMVDTFWKCNEKYFDNSLPTPWFETINDANVLGKFEHHKNNKNCKIPIRDQVISMSDCFDYPEKDFVEIMIHEMIHYYIAWNRIKDNKSHGKKFMQIADDIKRKYGLDAMKKISTSSFKLTENVPKIVKKKKLFDRLFSIFTNLTSRLC